MPNDNKWNFYATIKLESENSVIQFKLSFSSLPFLLRHFTELESYVILVFVGRNFAPWTEKAAQLSFDKFWLLLLILRLRKF